ncbi:DUF1963 domain-containing protein [Blastopirellula marina]|uniref:DUF1963 domain-containing protein n=1 Tax=Blastopirellula marina TaxID=124 RepID=A0A2S8FWN9_9BACT|nr:DUF1963 domain-containing protein [Blastopirellula marina]PQO36588.1 hypothetical protein C5Y98_11370 [Blastopirellula marina]PTL44418.1 DUF1963 domain-containing protein [Blastopirellula marina]
MTRVDFPLDRLLSKYGLEHHAALIHEGLEPSVRMNVGTKASRSLRIGVSKFGGLPHLAEGTFWPVRHNADHPLQFLAQIHLADLPEEVRQVTSLPGDGWLFFWFDNLANWQSTYTRLPPPEPHEYPYGLVTYAPEDAPLIRADFPDLIEPHVPAGKRLPHYRPPMFCPYSEHRVSFRRAMSLDKDSLNLLFARADEGTDIDADSDEWDRALELVEEMHGIRPGKRASDHRLLGSVYEPMGADMRAHAQRFYAQRTGYPLQDDPRMWIMLAKFDSDDSIHRNERDAGWLWGDGGSLCYWIRRTDLENGDFAKAVAVIGNAG